jgi:dienelactone hydrolase
VIALGVAFVLWDRGVSEEGARVLAPVGLEVEVVVTTSWSNVEPTDRLGSALSDLAQVAVAGPDRSGQILAARLFRLGDLDGATTTLRRLLEQMDGRILDDAGTTLGGRDVRVLEYELGSDGGHPDRLHRTYLVDLDDATHAWIDIGDVPAGDEEGRRTLDRIGATLDVRPAELAAEVELLTMDDDGRVGEFWTSRSQDGPRPGVLLLGGSGGGVPGGGGPLALAGYPTLALAYHGVEGLPETLAEIPLETFREALDWLAAHPEVDPQRLIVWGTSRGGEAALLIASFFPDAVDGVVANVPSDRAGAGYPDRSRAAWTLDGEPVARRTEQGQILGFNAPIEVERIDAPVLLTCGEQDTVWPSCPMSRRVVERFDEHDYPHLVVLREYDNEGHVANFAPLYVPTDVREAGDQGWRDALTFLDSL